MLLKNYKRNKFFKAGKLLIILTIPFIILACTNTVKPTKSRAKNTTKKPDLTMKSHMIKASEQKLLLKQVKEDLNLIMQANTEAELKQALTGTALKQTREQIKQDTGLGRKKIRRYSNIQLKFANYTKGIAGLSITFRDNSYYQDLKSGKPLTKPSNKLTKILVAVQKTGQRWKIFSVMSPKLKSTK